MATAAQTEHQIYISWLLPPLGNPVAVVFAPTTTIQAQWREKLVMFLPEIANTNRQLDECHHLLDYWAIVLKHLINRIEDSRVIGLTAAFEAGLTRCLVGTCGNFGEGWDSLGLNTLIDLTSVTTSTSVQQLRGRSIRLDPSWHHKVAHNWDVVCVAPIFEKGTLI